MTIRGVDEARDRRSRKPDSLRTPAYDAPAAISQRNFMLRSFDLFRKAALGCGLALAITVSLGTAHAGAVKILYAFKGGNDGDDPWSKVISDNQGNLYGTTVAGGGTGCGGQGCGTVFRLAPDGAETLLYAFPGGNDGANAYAGVVLDKQGNLYGTTEAGGGTGCGGPGCGTVFKLAPDGVETVLHAFKGGSDGGNPQTGLLRDKRGNLYGTTYLGGAQNSGTVFRITPGGTKSVIYAFCAQTNCTDGKAPLSSLIADKAGNLYGTTVYGGNPGAGTVFRIAPDGAETVLYSFCQVQPDCLDGAEPLASVTLDKSGNIYGTTSWGGADDGATGIIFKLAPDGAETALHTFLPWLDGFNPASDVIVDKAGNVYGTMPRAGSCKKRPGITYKLSLDGSEKLHCVPSTIDAGLIERNGTLYGTGTGVNGDKYPSGTVFAIKKD
jgi:uncharacterized repeat protein (TIGR03803 family)